MFSLLKKYFTRHYDISHQVSHLTSIVGDIDTTLVQSDGKIHNIYKELRRLRLAMELCSEQQHATAKLLAIQCADTPPLPSVMAYLESRLLYNLSREKITAEDAIIDVKLQDLMDAFGLVGIHQTHIPFDPALHEVCSIQADSLYEEDTVLVIVRPGFMLHGAVVRPALVVICREAEE